MYSLAWQAILNDVDAFMEQSSGTVWFRGHRCADYALNSGLFRLRLPDMDSYIRLEQQFYHYYQNLGWLLHENAEGWQLLYSMQHHGAKTRLLDWTESFAAAVYFATRNWRQGPACIWMLDPVALNYRSLGKREVLIPTRERLPYPESYAAGGSQQSIAVYPLKNTVRISAQHGIFTIQGNSPAALDKEFGGALVDEGCLRAIALTEDVRDDAQKFLRLNGINHFSLFPDLDGLAQYLNRLLIPDKNP